MDVYYDSTKVEELREKYAKVVFFHTPDKEINSLQSQLFVAQDKIGKLEGEKQKREALEHLVVEALDRINRLESKAES